MKFIFTQVTRYISKEYGSGSLKVSREQFRDVLDSYLFTQANSSENFLFKSVYDIDIDIQGQGHSSNKVENPYSSNVKLRSSITPVL